MVDGREHNPFPTITQRSMTFSPDSRMVAYIAALSGRWSFNAFVGEDAVVVDMVSGRTWRHDEISQKQGLSEELTFSPDSTRLAYAGVQNGRSFVVVDDKVNSPYDGLVSGWAGNPLWQKFPGHGHVGTRSRSIVFSPDSRQVAYAANSGSQHVLVLDGEEKARHPAILNQLVCFSPDSNHLAYGIEEAGKQRVVLDWHKLRSFEGMPPAEWSFSPDSTMLAFAAWDGDGNRHTLAVGSNILRLDGGFVIGARIVWEDNTYIHSLIAADRHVRRLKVVVDSTGTPSFGTYQRHTVEGEHASLLPWNTGRIVVGI